MKDMAFCESADSPLQLISGGEGHDALKQSAAEPALSVDQAGVGFEISFNLEAGDSRIPLEAKAEGFGCARLAAVLLYDSFNCELAGGMRSGPDAERYLLYSVGPLEIDLRLGGKSESDQRTITGQILDTRLDSQPSSGLVVRLLNEQMELARAKTGNFGEFKMEYGGGINHRFCLVINRSQDGPISRDAGNSRPLENKCIVTWG